MIAQLTGVFGEAAVPIRTLRPLRLHNQAVLGVVGVIAVVAAGRALT